MAGIRDIVGFHGESVADLEAAFHEAVDDYLSLCDQLGEPADRPTSGKLMLRIPPEIHAKALRSAELAGTSLNQWAAKVLEEASTK